MPQVRIGWRAGTAAQSVISSLLDTYGGASAAYSLRKLSSSYSGSAIRVRRSIDNTEQNIGFNASGGLDTTALQAFANPSSSGYLLDLNPGASVAYSLRKLAAAYGGSAIRVRRSSDNAEQNIGFNATGDLDTAALLAFAGSGSAFVTTWHDQSGAGNNGFQTTASAQPQIVNAGVLITRNSRPYIEATSSRYLQFTAQITASVGTNYSLWMTYEKDSGANQAILLKDAFNYHWLDYGTSQSLATSDEVAISAHAANTLYLINSIAGASGSTMYRNSLSIGSKGALTTQAQSLYLPSPSFRTAKITMSEFVYYPTSKNSQRAAISANINGYYSIHSPNGSAYVTTWYDQSGNGKNTTQATAAAQPMIVINGSISAKNGKPAIDFASGQFLRAEQKAIGNDAVSVFNVFSLKSLTSRVFAWDIGNSNPYAYFAFDINTYFTPTNSFGFYTNAWSAYSSQATNLGQNLLSVAANVTGGLPISSNISYHINGAQKSLTPTFNASGTFPNFSSASRISIGNLNGENYYFAGQQQELVIYASYKNSQLSAINADINSYYSVWDDIVTSSLVMSLNAARETSYSGTGTNWGDLSGSGNSLALNGPIFATANGGQFVFDGSNDFADRGAGINVGNKFTVQIWTKISKFGGNEGGQWRRAGLFNNSWNWTSNQGWAFLASSQFGGSQVATPGKEFLTFSLGQDQWSVSTNHGTMTPYVNSWVNLTAVVNGANPIRIYINGIETTYMYQSNGPADGVINYSLNNFSVGKTNNQDYLQGSVGNVYLYSKVLTQAEITQNFNATKSRFGY